MKFGEEEGHHNDFVLWGKHRHFAKRKILSMMNVVNLTAQNTPTLTERFLHPAKTKNGDFWGVCFSRLKS